MPVLFLDTAHHFAETYAYRDEIAQRWNLNLINLRADEPSVGTVAAEHAGVLRPPQGGAAVPRAAGL